jgi:TolB-like protein
MMVTDFTQVPGVRVVERDQLDVLLKEIKLSDSGFIDPSTAARVGKGVSARYVVTGSFTVAGGSLLLDARIIETESGTIVKAANAQGSTSDFVAAEKDLMEQLLSGLKLTLSSGERRRLMVTAPTESFDAFSAYGEGLQRSSEGNYDDAQQALNRAIALDPKFTQAQQELSELLGQLTARQDTLETEVRDARRIGVDAILADVPSELTRTQAWGTYAQRREEGAKYYARLWALDVTDQHCQRYAEMKHFMIRSNWEEEPSEYWEDQWEWINAYANSKGVTRAQERQEEQGVQRYLWSSPLKENGGTWGRIGYTPDEQSLLAALLKCHTGADALPEIDKLEASARASGHVPRENLDQLQLWWGVVNAYRFGPSTQLNQRMQAFVDAHRSSPDAENAALSQTKSVLALAQEYVDRQIRNRGLPDMEILRRVKLIAKGQYQTGDLCHDLVYSEWLARVAVQAHDVAPPSVTETFIHTGQAHPFFENIPWKTASDLGCFERVQPRYSSADSAWSAVEAAQRRGIKAGLVQPLASICPQLWSLFDNPAMPPSRSQSPFSALGLYYNLQDVGCISE